MEKNESTQQEIPNSWKTLLSGDDGGIKAIAKWLDKASDTKREAWRKVQNVVNYINLPSYFRYASLNALGLYREVASPRARANLSSPNGPKRGDQRFRPRGMTCCSLKVPSIAAPTMPTI